MSGTVSERKCHRNHLSKKAGNCTSVAFHCEAVECSFSIRSMLQIQASGSQSFICALGKQEQLCALRRGATHCYYQSDLRGLPLFCLQFERIAKSKQRKNNSLLFIWTRINNIKGMNRVPFGQVHPRSPTPSGNFSYWLIVKMDYQPLDFMQTLFPNRLWRRSLQTQLTMHWDMHLF